MVAFALVAASHGYAGIIGTTASVRSNNSLIVDIEVSTHGRVAGLVVAYQAPGIDRLVSELVPASVSGLTTITIGRLRANKAYLYTVEAIDKEGRTAGRAEGTFTTGSLPTVLMRNRYTLTGRTTVPLVILPHVQAIPGVGSFSGYVALDLSSSDAPQIVWYQSNAPSTASGVLQSDAVTGIIQERNGNFLYTDNGSGGPTAVDDFYRIITADGNVLKDSPQNCSVTAPGGWNPPVGWIWGTGNDNHEQLLPGADGVAGTVLHLGNVVKDPFFEAGLAPKGTRLQMGTTIRRWNPSTGTDEVVWDPFEFLDPLTERTDNANSDPGANSNDSVLMRCNGASLPVEGWTHSNSLQVAPTREILQSIRHLDTVVAISPRFDRIDWRIGRFQSDFIFPDPNDKFYHQHFVRMLEDGHLLLFDNGNGRPSTEGGQYSRALELQLDWRNKTATKVWEYRHPTYNGTTDPTYKYADKVGSAQRLENGHTLVLFGADVDPATLAVKAPQTFTLIEADAAPQARPLAVLDMDLPTNFVVYRALPVETLFGESPCEPHEEGVHELVLSCRNKAH
ncbi:MAG: aryl-sulfate sulfotransferase [Acidobacteriaceae bacterium]|nr:aryl-sulfate sulfotransferase [Acidobacteriaceae bacterium]